MDIISISIAVLAIIIVVVGVVQNRRSAAGGVDRSSPTPLAPCPGSSNCVSTYRNSGYVSLKPMRYEGINRDEARGVLLSLLESRPRCEVVTAEDDYVHAVVWSRIFRFRDDLEFHFRETEPVVDFRAASRVGHDDFGIHRKRMHYMTLAFEEAAREKASA